MQKSANRLLAIDALRGIAALIVLVYHSRANAWIGMNEFLALHHSWSWDPQVWIGWLSTPFRAGIVGVPLLFVLSGYCIHRNQAKLLAQGSDAKLDLPHFAFRRFFRIYPTYVAALIVNGLVLYQLLPWLGSRGFFLEPNQVHHSNYVFAMNLLTMQNILVPPYEGVFWSLSIEIHLYIAYPLVLWISRRFGPRRFMAVSLACGIVHTVLAFFLNDKPVIGLFLHATDFSAYWFTWCCGAYVAEMQFGRAAPIRMPIWLWVVIGAAGAALLIVGKSTVPMERWMIHAVGEFPLAAAIAAFLAWSLRPATAHRWDNIPGRLLGFVGMFSYSLYAIHIPILITFKALWGARPVSILPSIPACLMAIAVAYLFFNLVERWTLTPPKNFFVTRAPAAQPTHENRANI